MHRLHSIARTWLLVFATKEQVGLARASLLSIFSNGLVRSYVRLPTQQARSNILGTLLRLRKTAKQFSNSAIPSMFVFSNSARGHVDFGAFGHCNAFVFEMDAI